MRKKIIYTLLLITLFLTPRIYAAGELLKMPMGSIGIASGGAVTSWISGADALWYNPAGLIQNKKFEIYFNHMPYYVSTRIENIAIAFPMQNLKLAGFYTMLTSGNIDLRGDMPTLEPTGYAAYSESIMGIALSFKTGNAAHGILGKTYTLKYGDNTNTSFLFDYGFMLHHADSNNFYGAAIRNLGVKYALYEVRVAPPILIQTGYSRTFFKDIIRLSSDFNLELVTLKPKLNIGLNITPTQKFTIYMGSYSTNFKNIKNSIGSAAGILIHYNKLSLSYAIKYHYLLGLQQVFTIDIVQ